MRNATIDALQVLGRQRSATTVSSDPQTMAVIRAAEAACLREQVEFWIEEPELLQIVGAKTLDELAAILPSLQGCGFPAVHRAVKRGSFLRGTQDTPTVMAARHEYGQWRARFNDVAARLGFSK